MARQLRGKNDTRLTGHHSPISANGCGGRNPSLFAGSFNKRLVAHRSLENGMPGLP